MTWHQVLLVIFAKPIVVLIGKWVGVVDGWVNMIGLLFVIEWSVVVLWRVGCGVVYMVVVVVVV